MCYFFILYMAMVIITWDWIQRTQKPFGNTMAVSLVDVRLTYTVYLCAYDDEEKLNSQMW